MKRKKSKDSNPEPKAENGSPSATTISISIGGFNGKITSKEDTYLKDYWE